MTLMTAFTKKGYWKGQKYLVFKSYGNKIQGVLQTPSFEDQDGYIVHTTYSTHIDPAEQLKHLIVTFQATELGKCYYRIFDENGEPYEVV
jgi:elongation factor P--beta-lysine ligase